MVIRHSRTFPLRPAWRRLAVAALLFTLAALAAPAALADSTSGTSIFDPAATPARSVAELSYLVLGITGGIFVVVGGLLAYVIVRYRQRREGTSEPAQIYGSVQVELAWTVIPVLIVVVLFLTTARIIFAVQDAPMPARALKVTVVGHQFWWEYRYPDYGVTTANELHVPVSDPGQPEAVYLTLLSADTDHSFWVPRLAGKTDLIPNHPNTMWFDPHTPGLYLGQCAQFCGIQHAKMLLRVYVDSKPDFEKWINQQKEQAVSDETVAAGRHVFETQSCINCHTVNGTVANGRFGPDLTHFASRDTLGSGIAPNNKENLRAWIRNPDTFKPGSLMPAMQLTDQQLDQVTAYLSTLR